LKILSFDLELNQDPSGAKIIEVGACIGDIATLEVIESYSAFVNPKEPLLEYIIKLTSITQAQVEAAGTLTDAYRGMEALAARHDCLRQELPSEVEWSFGRRELDVKAVFQAYEMAKGEKVQAGLAKALTRLGLTFKGRKHRAIDDAINTFLIYGELLKKFS